MPPDRTDPGRMVTVPLALLSGVHDIAASIVGLTSAVRDNTATLDRHGEAIHALRSEIALHASREEPALLAHASYAASLQGRANAVAADAVVAEEEARGYRTKAKAALWRALPYILAAAMAAGWGSDHIVLSLENAHAAP